MVRTRLAKKNNPFYDDSLPIGSDGSGRSSAARSEEIVGRRHAVKIHHDVSKVVVKALVLFF